MSRQIIEQHAAGHEQRAEHKVHENIRCEVEDRAGGSDPDHKAAHAGSIPFPGFGNEFLVHVIPWDGGAGEVVDEIQENEVDAHHGQEGQQRRGCQHREHIAEVGAGRHLDVFDHIGVGLAALDDALLQHHQVFFQQDDVCRLLGYVHGGIHRDADVSSFHGGSVVDTVPHKAHGVAIFPQDGHHPCLLVRGQLRKHIGALCCPGKLCIGHMVQVGTQQHIADLQPHLLADGAGDLVVVAGKDFSGDTVVFQCSDGIGG